MPIVRTVGCPDCNHVWEITLTLEQCDDPMPSCPRCDERETQQIFRPVAIKGTVANARDIANRTAEQIAATDYHVANITRDRHEGATPKVSYHPIDHKGQRMVDNRPSGPTPRYVSEAPSTWGSSANALEQAVAIGRETRMKFGNGLDVLQAALKSGDQPDLIAASKRKSDRIW